MDDSKIFMFPDGGTRQTSSDVNSLLPLLMCNGGLNGGGSWVWIIFLFFLYPLMRNGGLFGNMGQNGGGCLGPLANIVNNNDGRDLIMQAINGNGAAVQRLATMFGTKVDMIQSAICQVNNSVAQVGCKIDSSTGALLNAGTQNTMTLANQLATCCCNLKNAITESAHFSMPNHTFRAMGVAGIMVINFSAATTTATGFEMMVNNVTLPLLASNGEALTALTAGLHIVVFDKQNNKLQLIV